MQDSRSWRGIGIQAINLAMASAMTICRAAKPMRRKLIPRFQCGSTWHLRPARQEISAGETTIRQQRDRPESGQQPINLLQQTDRHRRADAGTGMLQGLPEQRNRPAVADDRDHPMQKRFQSIVVSRARCKAWPGLCQG